MATFVEEVQSVADDNVAEFGRLLGARIETLGEALDVLEEWTEASRATHAELASKYDTAKRLARDEIREAGDSPDRDEDSDGNGEEGDEADLSAEELLDHPAVDDRTKRRLREYSTKLYVYLDEERSYGEARTELLRAIDAELDLYKRLLPAVEAGEISIADARQRIARFAREETPGPPGRTAADVVLESTVDE